MQCDTVTYRLEELAELCQDVARQLQLEGDNQRVQWTLTSRLIRYYTTLGLLDRAAQMKGRTAFYGVRHLLQVLAIKKLQAQGASLQEVQGHLLGASDGRLREILSLADDWVPQGAHPAPLPTERTHPAPLPAQGGSSRRSRFWAQPVEEHEVAPPLVHAFVPPAPVVGRALVELQGPDGVHLLVPQELFSQLEAASLQEWLNSFPQPKPKSQEER